MICDATLRVRRLPSVRRYEGWSFRSFAEGCEALRVLEQADAAPDVMRLSDGRGDAPVAGARLHRAAQPSAPGARTCAPAATRAAAWRSRATRAMPTTSSAAACTRRRCCAPAAGWRSGAGRARRGRATATTAPTCATCCWTWAAFVETLETATTWSNLPTLYAAVGEALRSTLRERGTPPLVMCHVSHLYRSGASLYYTFLARQEAEAPLEQWRAAKVAACDAIIANGGTITHHHAIGRDHAPWMAAEVGRSGST